MKLVELTKSGSIWIQYHGIVGDQTYRSGKTDTELINTLGNIYLNFKRQALHARKLSFVHPITLENKSFQTPLPTRFSKIRNIFFRIILIEINILNFF